MDLSRTRRPGKWWVRAMAAVALIRFAVLMSLAGVFAWLFYIRGGWLWAIPALVFALLAAATLRRS